MSVGLPSDDVAEDYKSSLEDIVDSSRAPIQMLTIIARENVEHASAISRVLENHIKTAPPNRKLPALYLLDSIVKIIGTPYTLFLSRNLYVTFMSAYSLVDARTRQKLDEMLTTWKQPNIGSTDLKPVFPHHITKPIEDALLKARNAAMEQNQRQASKMQQPHPGYRQISTPLHTSNANSPMVPPFPGLYGQSAPAMSYSTMNNFSPPSANVVPFHQPAETQNPNLYQQPRSYQPPPPPIDLPLLHRDIAELVRNAQAEIAIEPNNPSTQECLQALISLQTLLQQQYHPPEQLQKIRDQVTSLQAHRVSTAPRPALVGSTNERPQVLPNPGPSLPQMYTQQTRLHSPVDMQALMSSRNLASIIASAQKNSTASPLSQATGSNFQAHAATGASDLMTSLTRAGFLSTDSTLEFSSGSPGNTSGPHPALARLAPLSDLQLTSTSLKSARVELISLLYEAQPNQCTTCGRRFAPTEDGRMKRSKHYDWHFRTNSRINTSSKRAHNRSWYVDELEWIKTRDDPEGLLVSTSMEGQESSSASSNTKVPFIPVPTEQALKNQPCPICQEKFSPSYNDEVSDWVWMDAIKISDSRNNTVRVYHASCHRELKTMQSRENTPARTDTPDSILGKRKAIEDSGDIQGKLIKV